MPERHGAALLHWINPIDVRPLYYAASVTTPATVNAFTQLATQARAKSIAVAPLIGAGALAGLPPELAAEEAAIRETEQFRTAYEPLGAAFAQVTIRDLVAPQYWADVEYATELSASVPGAEDPVNTFRFCFAEGKLEPPMMLGANGAVIVSGRRSLGTLSPLRLRVADERKATFEFDALPRPNWLWLKGGLYFPQV